MKVLVVDDEAMICEWLQFCISQNSSCQLTGVAHNGQEALELFHRDDFDLILTDTDAGYGWIRVASCPEGLKQQNKSGGNDGVFLTLIWCVRRCGMGLLSIC